MHPKMKEMSDKPELNMASKAKLDMLKQLRKIALELMADSLHEEDSSEEPKHGMAVMIEKKEEMPAEMEISEELPESEQDMEEPAEDEEEKKMTSLKDFLKR